MNDEINPTDYFYEFIHEEDQPLELIQAVIVLLKKGFLNNENFSEKSRRNILEFHQENISKEDILYLLNNDIVPTWKSYLSESFLNDLNKEIIEKYSKQILFWLLDNEINHSLVPSLLINAEYDYYSLNKNQIDFIKETFSSDFFLDNSEQLKALYPIFLSDLSEKDLYRLINDSELLESLDHEEDVSLEFLKDYMEIHYQKDPTNFKFSSL